MAGPPRAVVGLGAGAVVGAAAAGATVGLAAAVGAAGAVVGADGVVGAAAGLTVGAGGAGAVHAATRPAGGADAGQVKKGASTDLLQGRSPQAQVAGRYHALARAATLRHAMRDTDAWAATIDPQYFELWAAYSGGLERRGKLDERTRLLVAVGQCVCTGEIDEMAGFVREALAKELDAREVLEVILQAAIYVGKPKTNRAAQAFLAIAGDLGPAPSIPRLNLEEEQPTWRVSDDEFPRREELMSRYGWQGIGAGIRTQPWHHARSIEWVDSVDQDFAQLWLDFIYAGMYCRRVLDDKTRTLTMVGDTVAVEELEQAENHMRNALILGATRDELLEICLHSTQFVGMPRSFKAARIALRIT